MGAMCLILGSCPVLVVSFCSLPLFDGPNLFGFLKDGLFFIVIFSEVHLLSLCITLWHVLDQIPDKG